MLDRITALVWTLRLRAQVKRSLGPILAREDDHLLRDIGLSRASAAALLHDPVPAADQYRMRAQAGTLCRSV